MEVIHNENMYVTSGKIHENYYYGVCEPLGTNIVTFDLKHNKYYFSKHGIPFNTPMSEWMENWNFT
jgi:hypothetical protein